MGAVAGGASRKIFQAGRTQEVPRHWHWDWGEKSKKLEFLAYRCFGIKCARRCRGFSW